MNICDWKARLLPGFSVPHNLRCWPTSATELPGQGISASWWSTELATGQFGAEPIAQTGQKQWDGLLLSLTASKVPNWKKRVFQ